MTISTTTTRVAYDGNGATTAFAVPFPFFAVSELEVIERSIATGTETTLTLGVHYSVAGGDGTTGTVTAMAAPATGAQWVVRRKTARTQATDYTPNDPFPAETHEKALDRLTMIAQELSETSDRAIKFPKTDAVSLTATVPTSVERAGKILAFDAGGNPAISNLTLTALEAQTISAGAAAASASAAAASASAAQSAQVAAESAAAGMKWRPSVKAASTANVNIASAPASLDGVAGAAGDRWLLKDQTTPSQNGVYVFNGAGAALTRAADADTWPELVSQCIAVEQGTVNADFTYICTVDQGGTLGTTAVAWASFKISLASATGTLPPASIANFIGFSAIKSSNQSLSSGVITKLTFDVEEFDSDGWYDNVTNHRFTALRAGKYRISAGFVGTCTGGTISLLRLYKNGNPLAEQSTSAFATQPEHYLSRIVSFNGTTDFVEVFASITGTTPVIVGGTGPHYTFFEAQYIGP